MKINISSVCDIGIERTNNEDAVAICSDLNEHVWNQQSTNGYVPLSVKGSLLIVADGMGGANAGEVASSLAIKGIEEAFQVEQHNNLWDSATDIHSFIRKSIVKSNQAILDYVLQTPDAVGLGTTIVLAWIIKDKVHIAWCGDSRCYCFNPNTGLRLLTKDHSLVQEMVDSGEIKREEAFNHPDNNIITRCLGDVDADPDPEVVSYKINDGDIFLLCSDGLCGFCDDLSIEKTMYRNYEDMEQCKKALLKNAMETGGQDNISIVLCATLSQDGENCNIGIKGRIKRFLSKL